MTNINKLYIISCETTNMLDKYIFLCYIITVMKFKKLYTLSLPLAITATMILGAVLFTENANKKDIKNTKTIQNNQHPKLIIEIDTLNLNRKNFNTEYPKAIAGTFLPTQNKVKVTYYNATDNATYINRICAHQNGMLPLTLRHELEHARKAHMTKMTTPRHNAQTRARIAAINEIMASSAEIIEAMDYHYTNKKPIPSCKEFVQNACNKILNTTNQQTPEKPVDFNNQKIADIVIENALERFKDETRAGQYISTLRREYYNTRQISYTPNQECDPIQKIFFAPEFNIWAPMWQFQTAGGGANLWLAATDKMHQKTLNTVDSIIHANTDKYPTINTAHKLSKCRTR